VIDSVDTWISYVNSPAYLDVQANVAGGPWNAGMPLWLNVLFYGFSVCICLIVLCVRFLPIEKWEKQMRQRVRKKYN
jgi:protein-S-isoprenylcysteine O-methyltransferase Ste14